MARTKEDASTTAVVENDSETAFYHFGLLPAEAPVEWITADPTKGGRDKTVHFSAWDLWNGCENHPAKPLKVFVAKARQFLGLAVRGHHFPSTSQHVEQTEEGRQATDFPGGVARLSKEQVDAIVKSSYKHILRFRSGLAKANDINAAVDIIDLDYGTEADYGKYMTPAEFSKAKASGQASSTTYTFNPKTDKYVAEFVYLRKLDADVEDFDEDAYAKNPNKFHQQLVGTMTKKFFSKPFKSIAETYSNPSA